MLLRLLRTTQFISLDPSTTAKFFLAAFVPQIHGIKNPQRSGSIIIHSPKLANYWDDSPIPINPICRFPSFQGTRSQWGITYSEFHNDRFYTLMVGDITMYISIIANVREHSIMNHINMFPFYSQYQYNNPPCIIIKFHTFPFLIGYCQWFSHNISD